MYAFSILSTPHLPICNLLSEKGSACKKYGNFLKNIEFTSDESVFQNNGILGLGFISVILVLKFCKLFIRNFNRVSNASQLRHLLPYHNIVETTTDKSRSPECSSECLNV